MHRYIYRNIHTHAHTYKHTSIHTYTRIHINIHTYKHTHVHTYLYTHTRTYVYFNLFINQARYTSFVSFFRFLQQICHQNPAVALSRITVVLLLQLALFPLHRLIYRNKYIYTQHSRMYIYITI